jgi:hypothetical protein
MSKPTLELPEDEVLCSLLQGTDNRCLPFLQFVVADNIAKDIFNLANKTLERQLSDQQPNGLLVPAEFVQCNSAY